MHYSNCTLTPSCKVHTFRKIYYCIWNHKQAFWFQHILTQNSIYSPIGVRVYYRFTHGGFCGGSPDTAIYIHFYILCHLSWQGLACLLPWHQGIQGLSCQGRGAEYRDEDGLPRLLPQQSSRFLRRWTSHTAWCSRRSRTARVVQTQAALVLPPSGQSR